MSNKQQQQQQHQQTDSSYTPSLNTMKEASIMKRSKTTYTESNSNVKSFGIHLTQEQRDPMFMNSPRTRKSSLSQANASWVHEPISADSSRNDLCSRQMRNIFLQNDKEINSLLNLLRTNDFSGQLDPKHHSMYLKEPTATLSSKRKPRRLGDKHHLSDGHLLQFKAAPGPLCT